MRTFQTGYCPDGHVVEYATESDGVSHLQRIRNSLLNKDKLRGLMENLKNKRKKLNLRKAFERLSRKQDNLVDDLHFKTCSDLTKNYQSILLPEFKTSEMVKKKNLGKITKRFLMSFKYYKFQQRLKEKCIENARTLHIVDESYTSKTCGRCGYIKKDLGSDKIYKCPECKLEISRDINGSRNILLKNLDCVLKQSENLRATSIDTDIKGIDDASCKKQDVNKSKIKLLIKKKVKIVKRVLNIK